MPHLRDERGETLAELMVTIAILGIAIVGILGAIGTAVITSDAGAKQATAQTVLRTYAEAVKAAPYVECAPSYAPSVSVPAGFTANVTDVAYGQGGANVSFGASCANAGYQRVTIQVASSDGRSAQSLQLVKRVG